MAPSAREEDAGVVGSRAAEPLRCLDMTAAEKGRSIASVYSVRPMPGATISTPLDWEVSATLDPAIYTMEGVLDRLESHGDHHAGLLKTKQRLGPVLRA